MTRVFTALIAVVLCVPAVRAADASIPDGYWRFSQIQGVNQGQLFLMKVETNDGKPTATVIANSSPKSEWKVGAVKTAGSTISIDVSIGEIKYTFEGIADAKDEKVIRGAMFDDSRTFRMQFNKQESDKLEPPGPGSLPKSPEPMTEATKFNTAVSRLRTQIFQTKDANNRAELQAKLKEAIKEAEEKTPPLYREVVAKHADSPYAVDAANQLMRAAGRLKPKADEVAEWVKVVEADGNKFGPRIGRDTSLQVGEMLIGQKDVAALALPLAEKIAGGIKDTDPLNAQSRAYKLLTSAQKAAGKTDAGAEAKLVKVEAALDAEYVKKVPPFKPEKFAGRKDKAANRVVVMELFTGAQCPPCVAADVGFDALEKAYDHKDLVLIQYHMHIPGPDPLTNLDSIARWDFYRGKFGAASVGGTPTTLFNGKTFDHYDKDPMHRGGGGMANAQNKFNQYKAIIDGLLEEKTTLKLDGAAKLAGDKLSIDVNVDGVTAPSEKVKLRVLLLEETIKYIGGNGLRFHHQVVRKGTEAVSLTDKSAKKTFAIDIAEVKKGLTKYLDEFAMERPFPYPDRPMELKNLKAVALVQDEDSGEILNAVQLDVK